MTSPVSFLVIRLWYHEAKPTGSAPNPRNGFRGEAAQWAGLQARTQKRNGILLLCFLSPCFYAFILSSYRFSLISVVDEFVQTLFKTLAISFSTMTLFTGITPLYGSSLQYAGPATLVWGWVVVSFFTWFVGIAMAEICSSFPVCAFPFSPLFFLFYFAYFSLSSHFPNIEHIHPRKALYKDTF